MPSSGRSSPHADGRRFLVLPENELACAALAPEETAKLITLTGPTGVGKTHLLRSALAEKQPLAKHKSADKPATGRTVSTTGLDFVTALIQASSDKTIAAFQHQFRADVTLMVMDDVNQLDGKIESQQQFLSAVDEILARGGRVILASTGALADLTAFSPRLRNRFLGGLCVAIQPPGTASRQRLAEHFARENNLILEEAASHRIAQETFSPRELRAVIYQLRHRRKGRRTTLNEQDVVAVVTEFRRPSWTIAEIARSVAEVYGLTVADLRSATRERTVAGARQVAMELTVRNAGASLSQIGKYFGGRSHSTVIHACERALAERLKNPETASRVARLEDRLGIGRESR